MFIAHFTFRPSSDSLDGRADPPGPGSRVVLTIEIYGELKDIPTEKDFWSKYPYDIQW